MDFIQTSFISFMCYNPLKKKKKTRKCGKMKSLLIRELNVIKCSLSRITDMYACTQLWKMRIFLFIHFFIAVLMWSECDESVVSLRQRIPLKGPRIYYAQNGSGIHLQSSDSKLNFHHSIQLKPVVNVNPQIIWVKSVLISINYNNKTATLNQGNRTA